MSDALERIKKLVALAASPSEEEARSSALIACRLMLEHKIELVDPKREPIAAVAAACCCVCGEPFIRAGRRMPATDAEGTLVGETHMRCWNAWKESRKR